MPAAIRMIPVTNGHTGPPGHGSPPRRPSTSAATMAATRHGSRTNALRSTAAGPRDRRCWRTRMTNSKTAQTAMATTNAASAAPRRNTSGVTTLPVHHSPRPFRSDTLLGPFDDPAHAGCQGYSDVIVTDLDVDPLDVDAFRAGPRGDLLRAGGALGV